MRLHIAALLVALPALGACSSIPTAASLPVESHTEAVAADVTNFSVLVGLRSLDEDDWKPVEDQLAIGVEVDQYDPNDAFGWEVGIQYSSDDGSVLGTDVGGSMTEFSFGIRKTFMTSGRFHPYLGGGLAAVRAESDITGGSSDQDNSPGGYVHGGVYWNVGQNLNIGFDVRSLLFTDITLNGVDANSDYVQYAFVAGLAF